MATLRRLRPARPPLTAKRPWRSGSAIIGALTVLLMVSIVCATFVGTANIGAADVISVIARHLGLGSLAPTEPLPKLLDSLVWQARIPRVLLAGTVGMALAVSGAVLQSITRNPLAEPYLLGVSSGASTGAVLIMVAGVGSGAIGLSLGAFIGALVSFAAVLLLIGGGTVANPVRVVLTGVLVSQFFSAITSMILMLTGDADSTRGFTFWLLGSLSGARWDPLMIAAIIVVASTVGCIYFADALDTFTFGWDAATSLGINVTQARIILMILTALMTAAAVAVSGAIGFIGLLIPHIVRILTGSLHRLLLPASALAGAIFLIWVDALARTAFSPHELPVGVITALLGAPVFALVLRRGTIAR